MTMRLSQDSMSEAGRVHFGHKVDELPTEDVSHAETMQACRNAGQS